MIMARRSFQVLAIVALMATWLVAAPSAHATAPGTITVNTTANALSDGLCSLPEAVNLVDGVAGSDACARSGSTAQDIIQFSISSGLQTITLGSTLELTAPVTLDASTQPGYIAGSPGEPKIVITGALAKLIRFESGSTGSIVRAVRWVNTTSGSSGIAVSLETDGILVAGNYFDTDGSASIGGDDTTDVFLMSSAVSMIGGATTADRNLFGGVNAVRIDNGSGNTIRGNYFGVTAGGSTALSGLTYSGLAINLCFNGCTSSVSNQIRDNVITGYGAGIWLNVPTALNEIKGNLIGVGANGTTKLKNGYGIYVAGSVSNNIGGTSAADRNVISGNNHNIYLINDGGSTPDSNVIQGNYIGTTADGLGRTTAYGDSTGDIEGIDVESGAGNADRRHAARQPQCHLRQQRRHRGWLRRHRHDHSRQFHRR